MEDLVEMMTIEKRSYNGVEFVTYLFKTVPKLLEGEETVTKPHLLHHAYKSNSSFSLFKEKGC